MPHWYRNQRCLEQKKCYRNNILPNRWCYCAESLGKETTSCLFEVSALWRWSIDDSNPAVRVKGKIVERHKRSKCGMSNTSSSSWLILTLYITKWRKFWHFRKGWHNLASPTTKFAVKVLTSFSILRFFWIHFWLILTVVFNWIWTSCLRCNPLLANQIRHL